MSASKTAATSAAKKSTARKPPLKAVGAKLRGGYVVVAASSYHVLAKRGGSDGKPASYRVELIDGHVMTGDKRRPLYDAMLAYAREHKLGGSYRSRSSKADDDKSAAKTTAKRAASKPKAKTTKTAAAKTTTRKRTSKATASKSKAKSSK